MKILFSSDIPENPYLQTRVVSLAKPADIFRALENGAHDKVIAGVSDWIADNPKAINTFHDPATGETLLHAAIAKKDAGLVQWLLQKQANPNAYILSGKRSDERLKYPTLFSVVMDLNPFSSTPLSVSKQILGMLLEAGADFTLKTHGLAENILHFVARQAVASPLLGTLLGVLDHKGLLKELLAAPAFNKKSPIHMAAETGHRETMLQLIKAGADVNMPCDPIEWQPLHFAVGAGRADMVRLLLDQGASARGKARNLETPLHLLLEENYNRTPEETRFDIFNMLVGAGAELDATTDTNISVLQMAAKQESSYYAEKLVPYYINNPSLNINAEDLEGRTALHQAARSGSIDTVKLLIEAGADVKRKTKKKETMIHMAAANPDSNVLKYFIETHTGKKEIDPNALDENQLSAIWPAVEAGQPKNIELLLPYVNIQARNKDKETLLHRAIMSGNSHLLPTLIEAGADPDVPDQNGDLPLTLAIIINHANMVQSLIHGKANLNMKSGNGDTPLHTALQYFKGENETMILHMLMEAGADPTVKNTKGLSAMDWVKNIQDPATQDVFRNILKRRPS